MFYWMNSLSRYMTYKFLGNLKFLGSKFLWFRNLETCLELEKETISDALPLEVASIAPVVLGFNEEFHIAPAYQILAKSDKIRGRVILPFPIVASSSILLGRPTIARRSSVLPLTFLPRFTQCRRGLAMRKLSVRPSVRLSVCLSVRLTNAWIVTKRKKDLSRFLRHTRDHLA